MCMLHMISLQQHRAAGLNGTCVRCPSTSPSIQVISAYHSLGLASQASRLGWKARMTPPNLVCSHRTATTLHPWAASLIGWADADTHARGACHVEPIVHGTSPAPNGPPDGTGPAADAALSAGCADRSDCALAASEAQATRLASSGWLARPDRAPLAAGRRELLRSHCHGGLPAGPHHAVDPVGAAIAAPDRDPRGPALPWRGAAAEPGDDPAGRGCQAGGRPVAIGNPAPPAVAGPITSVAFAPGNSSLAPRR